MIQSIPIRWLVVQASQTPVANMMLTSFFKSVYSGADPASTPYYDLLKARLGPNQAYARVIELASHQTDPLQGFCPPVHLRHDGLYELRDGHHRVGAAVARGATSIDCDVQDVNPLWTAITSMLPKRLYQPIDHPWFADRDVVWPGKISMVTDHLKSLVAEGRISNNGNAVDIGCYTGGMSRSLRSIGLATYAIDNDPRMLQVAGYLDLIFRSGAVYSEIDLRKKTPVMMVWPREVTTILSVFHHFLGEATDVEIVKTLLQSCSNYSRATIIDIPLTTEGWMTRLSGLETSEAIRSLYLAPFKNHTVTEIAEMQGRQFLSIVKK